MTLASAGHDTGRATFNARPLFQSDLVSLSPRRKNKYIYIDMELWPPARALCWRALLIWLVAHEHDHHNGREAGPYYIIRANKYEMAGRSAADTKVELSLAIR